MLWKKTEFLLKQNEKTCISIKLLSIIYNFVIGTIYLDIFQSNPLTKIDFFLHKRIHTYTPLSYTFTRIYIDYICNIYIYSVYLKPYGILLICRHMGRHKPGNTSSWIILCSAWNSNARTKSGTFFCAATLRNCRRLWGEVHCWV